MPLHPAPLAVDDGGGGGAVSVALPSAGPRLPKSHQPAHLGAASQPETGCPADPGGPPDSPTGTAVTIHVEVQ